MNCIIPFEDKIKFNYPVVEINSISLEHEYTINDLQILGNFLISGTCKEHKLSINTTDFNFTIPFDVSIPEDIDTNSLELTIDNFTYDLIDNELNINISYILKANDIVRELTPIIKEEPPVIETVNEDTRQIKSIYSNFIDDYQTYQIYIVKEEDTISSISLKFNIDSDTILKINNIDKINIQDKLLIPVDNE